MRPIFFGAPRLPYLCFCPPRSPCGLSGAPLQRVCRFGEGGSTVQCWGAQALFFRNMTFFLQTPLFREKTVGYEMKYRADRVFAQENFAPFPRPCASFPGYPQARSGIVDQIFKNRGRFGHDGP